MAKSDRATPAGERERSAPSQQHACRECKKPGYWYDDAGTTLCPRCYRDYCEAQYE